MLLLLLTGGQGIGGRSSDGGELTSSVALSGDAGRHANRRRQPPRANHSAAHPLALRPPYPTLLSASLPLFPSVQVIAVVLTQFSMAYAVRDWAWWKLWIVAYVVSGTLNQNLFCAQHEISHFLAFKVRRWCVCVCEHCPERAVGVAHRLAQRRLCCVRAGAPPP